MHSSTRPNQEGFSIIEMMIAVGVMVIVTAAVCSLMRDSIRVSKTTYELTDAQENLRTSQEYVNRDLMNAGDGLKSISMIRVPQAFVTNYLTLNPITDAGLPAGVINLGILTSDNNVPGTTVVQAASPAATIRNNTDRQTILEMDTDPDFPIGLAATAIDVNGSTMTVPDVTKFTVGEIYFITSSLGGAFGAITGINNGAKQLSFSNGDTYGLNLTGANGHIKTISGGGTLATSLMRMRIIHYYVNSTGLLMRRVFGVKGVGMRESIIAEHVLNVQFVYGSGMTDVNGNVLQPTSVLATPEQRLAVRQVEVTVSAETPHLLPNGTQPQLTMTTSTSVRNMQFRQALQPQAP